MKSMIAALWLGKLSPWSDPEAQRDETLRYARISEELFGALMSKLEDEEKSLLREYERIQNEYLSLAREDAFRKGFSMGLQLSAEAFLRE